VPFEFPGNRERIGDFYLPDDSALQKMFASDRRVLIVSPIGSAEKFRQISSATPFHLVTRVGQWELFSNR
jgi:hypothetical protein